MLSLITENEKEKHMGFEIEAELRWEVVLDSGVQGF